MPQHQQDMMVLAALLSALLSDGSSSSSSSSSSDGDAAPPSVVHPPWDAPFTNQGHACTDGTPSAPSRANARWSSWAAPEGPVPPGGWPVYLEFTSQPSTFIELMIATAC